MFILIEKKKKIIFFLIRKENTIGDNIKYLCIYFVQASRSLLSQTVPRHWVPRAERFRITPSVRLQSGTTTMELHMRASTKCKDKDWLVHGVPELMTTNNGCR